MAAPVIGLAFAAIPLARVYRATRDFGPKAPDWPDVPVHSWPISAAQSWPRRKGVARVGLLNPVLAGMVSGRYAGRLGSAPAGRLFVLAYVVGSLVCSAAVYSTENEL